MLIREQGDQTAACFPALGRRLPWPPAGLPLAPPLSARAPHPASGRGRELPAPLGWRQAGTPLPSRKSGGPKLKGRVLSRGGGLEPVWGARGRERGACPRPPAAGQPGWRGQTRPPWGPDSRGFGRSFVTADFVLCDAHACRREAPRRVLGRWRVSAEPGGSPAPPRPTSHRQGQRGSTARGGGGEQAQPCDSGGQEGQVLRRPRGWYLCLKRDAGRDCSGGDCEGR